MAEIVANRLVEHLERAGFGVMKRPAARRRLDADFDVQARRICFSIKRFVLWVQSNRRFVRFLLRTLGFGDVVGANKHLAF
jgi:hypothetical protein